MTFEEFFRIIDEQISTQASIDNKKLTLLARAFETPSGTRVQWNRFLDAYQQYQTLDKCLSYIFSALRTMLEAERTGTSLTSFLQQHARGRAPAALDSEEL